MWNNFLVDADETILDFIRSSKESFYFALEEAGIPCPQGRFEQFKMINDSLWREYEKGEIKKERLVVERFARLFMANGIEKDAAKVNKIYFDKLCKTGYMLEGAKSFLFALKELGKIYLITNGTPAAQYGRLEALGIRNIFDGIFVSDEIGFAKPSREFFNFVLNSIGRPARECVVIGDSLTSDIRGANLSGISSIWYAPAGGVGVVEKPDYTAKNYEDILNIIRVSE